MVIPRILIVEDDADWLEIYTRCLAERDYNIVSTRRLKSALTLLREQSFDIVLTDLKMFGGREEFSGFDVLTEARTINPDIQVIVITGYGSSDHALRAMGNGAYDYITKDRDLRKKLPLTVQSALEIRVLKAEMLGKRLKDDISPESNRIIGNSAKMQAVFGEISRAAANNNNVLIFGESGTGKRLIAQTIHRQSNRKRSPFFVIDCGSLPSSLLDKELLGYEAGTQHPNSPQNPGRIEKAHQGTVFLDGIAFLDSRAQAYLANILSEKQITRVGGEKAIKVDVRVIASSSNNNLKELLASGQFRRDLFDILNETSIAVPLLRERNDGDDIPALAAMFLQRHSANDQVVLSSETVLLLNQYDYPGNVRELESIIKEALARCKGPVIEPQHLRRDVREYQPGQVRTFFANLGQLRQRLNISFNTKELKELCFDLGIDYDNLSGSEKGEKIIEVVTYLDRRNRLNELLSMCRDLRPDVNW